MQTPFGYWHYKGDQMLQFCGTAQHFGPLIPPSESKSLILIGCSIQKLAVHGRHFSKIWPLTALQDNMSFSDQNKYEYHGSYHM